MSGNEHIRTVLQEMVRRLVAEYAPEKIILFGSYAYGEPHEDSDIDLFIIKDTQEPYIDRKVKVRRTVRGTHPRIPLDSIVMTPQEVQQRLKIGDQFVEEILEKGELLYAG
jgi:predicted nucleotidyltransferase